MSKIPERPLTNLEISIISKLLERPFPGSAELKKQLGSAVAIPTGDNDNYGSIYLKTSATTKAPVTSRVPVEGSAKDNDGIPIDVILHVIDGYVNELEIVKMDGTDLISPLNPDKIDVVFPD